MGGLWRIIKNTMQAAGVEASLSTLDEASDWMIQKVGIFSPNAVPHEFRLEASRQALGEVSRDGLINWTIADVAVSKLAKYRIYLDVYGTDAEVYAVDQTIRSLVASLGDSMRQQNLRSYALSLAVNASSQSVRMVSAPRTLSSARVREIAEKTVYRQCQQTHDWINNGIRNVMVRRVALSACTFALLLGRSALTDAEGQETLARFDSSLKLLLRDHGLPGVSDLDIELSTPIARVALEATDTTSATRDGLLPHLARIVWEFLYRGTLTAEPDVRIAHWLLSEVQVHLNDLS